jgi:hypothetical protein
MKKRILIGIVAAIAAFSIIGCKEDDGKKNEPETGFKLTVTGLQSGINGASLLDQTQTPVATAMLSGGVFTFFHPGSNPAMPMPDFNRPFRTAGSYYVALAQVDFSTLAVTGAWSYAPGGQPAPIQVSGDFTLPMGNFADQDMSGYNP